MILKNIFTILLSIVLLSCNKVKSVKDESIKADTLQTNSIKVNSPIITLNPKAKKMTENWGEYQKLNGLIQQYQKISISNALLNAKELSELSKQLKDSIRVEKLKIPSVKIRLNVLHNETLRLADMSTINHIENEEIIKESENILEAFSALNLKINNIIHQEKLNEDVNQFIEEIINSDSTNSKKTIKSDTLNLNQIQL